VLSRLPFAGDTRHTPSVAASSSWLRSQHHHPQLKCSASHSSRTQDDICVAWQKSVVIEELYSSNLETVFKIGFTTSLGPRPVVFGWRGSRPRKARRATELVRRCSLNATLRPPFDLLHFDQRYGGVRFVGVVFRTSRGTRCCLDDLRQPCNASPSPEGRALLLGPPALQEHTTATRREPMFARTVGVSSTFRTSFAEFQLCVSRGKKPSASARQRMHSPHHASPLDNYTNKSICSTPKLLVGVSGISQDQRTRASSNRAL
jgi:hypothetical protein